MTCQALPPELWAIILDLDVVEASVSPAERCTHWKFPEISHGLGLQEAFEKFLSVVSPYRNLRTVCRTFRDLWSPHHGST